MASDLLPIDEIVRKVREFVRLHHPEAMSPEDMLRHSRNEAPTGPTGLRYFASYFTQLGERLASLPAVPDTATLDALINDRDHDPAGGLEFGHLGSLKRITQEYAFELEFQRQLRRLEAVVAAIETHHSVDRVIRGVDRIVRELLQDKPLDHESSPVASSFIKLMGAVREALTNLEATMGDRPGFVAE